MKRLSASIAVLVALAAAPSAQAGWFDAWWPTRAPMGQPLAASWQAGYVVQPSVPVAVERGDAYVVSSPATPVSWGGPQSAVVVEPGCGCGYEVGCGCSYEVGCGWAGWGCHWRPFAGCCFPKVWTPRPCWSCRCRGWFSWLHRCHWERSCGYFAEPSCGCSYEPTCGCSFAPACGQPTPVEWKAPVTPAPTPVNPPRPMPEKAPAKTSADRKA